MESTIKIVNVVVSAWTDKKLSIEKIARSLAKSIYEPDTFAGLVYHRQVPKATIIMFSSGRIVTTGTTSVKYAKQSLNVTLQEISKIMHKELKLKSLKTENIVTKAAISTKINLDKLKKKCKNTSYEPDRFPAVIYLDKPNPSYLIFSTGKIISAGAKNETQARKSMNGMVSKIKKLGCFVISP